MLGYTVHERSTAIHGGMLRCVHTNIIDLITAHSEDKSPKGPADLFLHFDRFDLRTSGVYLEQCTAKDERGDHIRWRIY